MNATENDEKEPESESPPDLAQKRNSNTSPKFSKANEDKNVDDQQKNVDDGTLKVEEVNKTETQDADNVTLENPSIQNNNEEVAQIKIEHHAMSPLSRISEQVEEVKNQ